MKVDNFFENLGYFCLPHAINLSINTQFCCKLCRICMMCNAATLPVAHICTHLALVACAYVLESAATHTMHTQLCCRPCDLPYMLRRLCHKPAVMTCYVLVPTTGRNVTRCINWDIYLFQMDTLLHLRFHFCHPRGLEW